VSRHVEKITRENTEAEYIRIFYYEKRKKKKKFFTLYTKLNTIPLGKTKASIYQKQLAFFDFLDEMSFEYM
jgi:hypothetical protein